VTEQQEVFFFVFDDVFWGVGTVIHKHAKIWCFYVGFVKKN